MFHFQGEYNIIHSSEDENFSLTATVINLSSDLVDHLVSGDDGGGQAEAMSPVQENATAGGDHPTEKDCPAPSPPKEAGRKRSLTRQVQIPSRFRDFDTEPAHKRTRLA